MNRFSFNRCGLVVALVLLSGCGGHGSGTIPETDTSVNRPATTAHGTFLYVASGESGLSILTYPALKPVATIPGDFAGGCVDPVKHTVFFRTFIDSIGGLTEYAIGETRSIENIVIPSGQNAGPCSVDPTTGNVAVIVDQPKTDKAEYIAVYSLGVSGTPERLRDSKLGDYRDLTYDQSGNLFVAGEIRGSGAAGLSEIRKGSHKFTALVPKGVHLEIGPLQWVGRYLLSEYVESSHIDITRLAISGTNAKYVGMTHLKHATVMAFIYGDKAAAILSKLEPPGPGQVGLYHYPAGRQRIGAYWHLPHVYAFGVLIAASK